MKFTLPALLASCLPGMTMGAAVAAPAALPLRPPAVPLVATDPYFSVWSNYDHLTDGPTRHWTGTAQPLTSLIRIDGKTCRVMGDTPARLPALTQTALRVTPTSTRYAFTGNGVRLSLTFLTPLLPSDLNVLSRPVTYLTWQAASADGKAHQVSIYFDAGAELAVNTPDEAVIWQRVKVGPMNAMKIGTQNQPILAKAGDNLRINWGYLYVAPLPGQAAQEAFAPGDMSRDLFDRSGALPPDDMDQPRTVSTREPVAATVFNLGKVTARPVSRTLMIAYDDLYGIQYFHQNLRSYWRRKGADAPALLTAAAREYAALVPRCAAFDTSLTADMTRLGGAQYASLAALAYRQCLAACKLVADPNGQPLLLPKENYSNGCIATVDVIYPQEPLFLLLSPLLTKATLAPVLEYASAPGRWKFSFAPHDIGTYPLANGQVYGGREKTEDDQMPVEETGNMLLLLDALAHAEGNADFAGRYWPMLGRWADYLKTYGLDPENQLCTDDFAGHLAHNANLSVKAIDALGAYADLCALRGDKARATQFRTLALDDAKHWVQAAQDGDHSRLAFDKPGTWSQKYNLVWDKILNLNLFPASVAQSEMAFYKKHINVYGLPLDNRKSYTKADWTSWTATLTRNPADFDTLMRPVYAFVNATPDRVPLTDWYETTNAKKIGFQARSVVGGIFLRALYEPALWKKWARQDTTLARKWAPIPPRPTITPVVPAAQAAPVAWRYTTDFPPDEWKLTEFNDAAWPQGSAGFGSKGVSEGVTRTPWTTSDIWMRREFTWPVGTVKNVYVLIHHDEDAEVYVNGVLALKTSGYLTDYDAYPMLPEAVRTLHSGINSLAVHCHQTIGGQYIDVGIGVAQ